MVSKILIVTSPRCLDMFWSAFQGGQNNEKSRTLLFTWVDGPLKTSDSVLTNGSSFLLYICTLKVWLNEKLESITSIHFPIGELEKEDVLQHNLAHETTLRYEKKKKPQNLESPREDLKNILIWKRQSARINLQTYPKLLESGNLMKLNVTGKSSTIKPDITNCSQYIETPKFEHLSGINWLWI